MTVCPAATLEITHTGTTGPAPECIDGPSGARDQTDVPTLRQLCVSNRWRLAVTYAILNVENAAELAQPWLLGLTITGLISGNTPLLWGFAAFFVTRMGVGVVRRMYDTRAFARLYGQLATTVIVSQRRSNVAVSSVAARASLSREVTDFLEYDVPAAFSTGYYILGGLVMIGIYDPLLIPVVLCAGAAGVALNTGCARHARRLNQRLNDVLENEVQVVAHGTLRATSEHYAGLAYWQVRVSDWHAMTYSATQAFVLVSLVAALFRVPHWGADSIGDIYALLRYVTMFNMGIGGMPRFAQRIARLRDIGQRFLVAR